MRTNIINIIKIMIFIIGNDFRIYLEFVFFIVLFFNIDDEFIFVEFNIFSLFCDLTFLVDLFIEEDCN